MAESGMTKSESNAPSIQAASFPPVDSGEPCRLRKILISFSIFPCK